MAARTPKRGSNKHIAHGVQYAALPYRWGEGLEILLVTSRETRRWVIPKGWPMPRKTPHAAAGREAMEEAGVSGKIRKSRLGRYGYIKRLKDGANLSCTVEVYPLAVLRQLKRWPEKGQRTAQWFSPEAAAQAVQEPDLAALILKFAAKATPPKAKPKAKDKVAKSAKPSVDPGRDPNAPEGV